MPTSKLEYFKSEGQTKPDISIKITRVDSEKIKDWTPEQRRKAREFLKQAQKILQEHSRIISTR